jgi:hypothetical protein
VPVAQLVKVAGSRWKIEDGFAGGKELAALDEHQVRSWTSWHRWTILALLACAFLSVLAAAQPGGSGSRDDLLIPLTRNEIRRLLTGLSRPPARQLRSCTGPDGDAATSSLHEPVITADEHWLPHDHKLSLE